MVSGVQEAFFDPDDVGGAGVLLPYFFDPPREYDNDGWPVLVSCGVVHVYLFAPNKEILELAHARSRAATGVKLWNTIRGHGHKNLPQMQKFGDFNLRAARGSWWYFEWSVGDCNGLASGYGVAKDGWSAFLSAYRKLLAERRQMAEGCAV